MSGASYRPTESYPEVRGPLGSIPAPPEQDRRALRDLTLAVVIGLAGAVTEDVIDILPSVQRLVTATATPNGTVVRLPSPWLWVALLTVGGALAVAEVMLFRRAFGRLRLRDGRFSDPASLSVLAAIGILTALVGVAVLLNGIYRAVACAGPAHPLTPACLSGTGFTWGIAVLSFGVVLGLVGYVGILISIWRCGRRYGDSRFKFGVILLIFPLLNVIGAVLILVGARKALERVGTGSNAPPTAVR